MKTKSEMKTLVELQYYRSSLSYDDLTIGEIYVVYAIDITTYEINFYNKQFPRIVAMLTDKFSTGSSKFLSFEINQTGYYAKHTIDLNYHCIKKYQDYLNLNKN